MLNPVVVFVVAFVSGAVVAIPILVIVLIWFLSLLLCHE